MNLILQAIKSMFRNIEQQIAKLYKKTEDLQMLSEIKPDWNQNDETASDYVKNRTHWVDDPVETVLLEETSIETVDDVGIYGEIPASIMFVEGQTYTVTFNGAEYECVAWCYDDEDSVVIGDGSIIYGEGGNGEPFACDSYSDGFCYLNTPNEGTYTIKITTRQSEIHKLDEKFLPPIIGRSGEGESAEIFNDYSMNVASSPYSHAEGHKTTASGWASHAEGRLTTASDEDAHAEGRLTTASGWASHAEGYETTTSGNHSHAEGYYTIASSENQHAQGKFNVIDADEKYAHIVGNGTGISSRSNAHTLDWDGLGWFAGGLKVGGTGQDDEVAKEVALKEDIPSLPTPSTADSGKTLTVQPDGYWGLSPASEAMTVVDDGKGNLTFLNVSVSTQEV